MEVKEIEKKLDYIIDNMDANREVFNRVQACKYLGICQSSFDTLVRNGEIRFKVVGKNKKLFHRDWLNSWLCQAN